MTAASTRPTRREPTEGHLQPEDFRHCAACRSVDPEIFFPTAVAGPEFETQVALAKTVCAGCPVREQCLTWALTRLPDGIAGGMTEHERRHELVRRRGRRGGRLPLPLPLPRIPQRPVNATRAEVAAAGRAAIAAGMSVPDAAGEFLVSARTAGRWARDIHPTTSTHAGEGSTGGHRAPLQISHTATQAGTRAEGNRS